MKHLFFYFFALFISLSTLAQERFYSNAEVDLIANNKYIYFYNLSDNTIKEEVIEPKGFLLKSFSIQYDYNYLIGKKLSFGLLTGYERQNDPDFNMLKLGAVIRYFVVDQNNAFLYIQDSNNFSLNKDKFKSGNNFRIGVGIPVLKNESFNINSTVFFQQNYFKLNKDYKLIGYTDEIPRDLTAKAIGISFSAKF